MIDSCTVPLPASFHLPPLKGGGSGVEGKAAHDMEVELEWKWKVEGAELRSAEQPSNRDLARVLLLQSNKFLDNRVRTCAHVRVGIELVWAPNDLIFEILISHGDTLKCTNGLPDLKINVLLPVCFLPSRVLLAVASNSLIWLDAGRDNQLSTDHVVQSQARPLSSRRKSHLGRQGHTTLAGGLGDPENGRRSLIRYSHRLSRTRIQKLGAGPCEKPGSAWFAVSWGRRRAGFARLVCRCLSAAERKSLPASLQS
jgi:hypothetical protein